MTETEVQREVVIVPSAGLHARPAAGIASLMKGFSASAKVESGDKSADARSQLGLLTLGAACGATAKITAAGEDAVEAVDAIARVLTTEEEGA